MNEDNKLDNKLDNNELNNSVDILSKEEVKVKECEFEIESLKKQLLESEKKVSYVLADIQNIKRNTFKDIANESQRACSRIILEILNVYDDFERGLQNIKSNNALKNSEEGLELINKSFQKALSSIGIEEINTNISFDPNIHEAISQINDETKKNDSIVSVAKKGYLYKKNMIRPAQVVLNIRN